jgi:hypothetical protein
MSKEKQIEEMAKVICGNNRDCKTCVHNSSIKECGCIFYANRLYEQGYRKQSEVVKAIADFMYDGEIEGLAISMGGAFLTKNEFIDKFAERR